jgi:hypothetical protein
MNFDNLEENIVMEYWKTLIRKDILNININKFIKKPYLENYIIKLSIIIDNESLVNKISELIESDKIINDEIFLFLNNNLDLSIEQKKHIELFFIKNDFDNEDFKKLSIDTIIYQIKYFRFYQTITELLFDGNIEDNELYTFIFIFIKNKKNEIKQHIKKNIKFHIFYFYISELHKLFESLFKLLIINKLIKDDYTEKDILNIFLKNLFSNWYNIYKKDILDNKVNDKTKEYILTKSFISHILCLPSF